MKIFSFNMRGLGAVDKEVNYRYASSCFLYSGNQIGGGG